jgi:tryptophanyl-tRNA synthetase
MKYNSTMKKRVLSGIRATGRLHLGNYLGAVKGMVELANSGDYETFFMVADLHTLTTPYDKGNLANSTREIIIDYLAAGLDPDKSTLFVQSQVPEHLELSYFFSTVTTVAKMQHLTTFKDKVKQHPENVTMALLNYPVLMAADILVYKAELVPVGIDQEPHLEVAREIARRFNQDYGTDFPEPKRFATSGEYVPSLTGKGKMSKSVEGSFINLNDSLEEITKKVRSVPTSSEVGGEKTGGIKTLFEYLKLFDEGSYDEFDKEFEGGTLKYVELKDHIAEAIFAELSVFQGRRAEIEANPEYVDQIIHEGAQKARVAARTTVKEIREKIGLI